jgi:hypothetical protein
MFYCNQIAQVTLVRKSIFIFFYKTLGAYHRLTAIMPSFDGFEIKREEKYFVFIWMSRKERVITEKMNHQPVLGRKPYL